MKNFLLFLLPVLSLNSFSAPYWGNIEKFKQPDGTFVDVKLFGDEFYLRAEGLDGYTLVRDKKTNWICYAELSKDKAKLLSTGIIYKGKENDVVSLKTSLPYEKHLDISQSAIEKIQSFNSVLLNGGASSNKYGNSQAPLTTNMKGLCIVVDFSDQPGSLPLSDFQNFCNGTNYTGFGNHGSLKEFYNDITGGIIIYDNVVYGYYRAQKTFAQYDAESYTQGAHEVLNDALNWVQAQGFNFSTLTLNNGAIRAINLMYTGTPANWAQGMWWHKGYYSGWTSSTGIKSGDYNCSPATSPLKMGVVCHENGHMIGAWPDTYKYNSTTGPDGIGAFDLMCAYGDPYNPVPPNPYFLSRNNWGQTIDVTTTGADINDPTNALIYYKYRNVNNSAEYYITQSVQKTGRHSSNPDEGVTIWQVNTNGNNQTTTPEISLIHANNNINVHSAACYKSGTQDFDDNTTPNAHWLNNSASGFRVWDFGTVGSTMHYKIGNVSTVPPTNLAVNASACPQLAQTLNWQNSGSNWWADVSDDPNYTNYWNKSIANSTSTSCPDGFQNFANTSQYLQLQPNTTYYWRLWDGTAHYSGQSFTTPNCVSTFTSCSGNFADDGGTASPYNNNEDYLTVIQPANASAVTMNFSSFDIELDYDSLWIYDGALPGGTLLGIYTGTNSPGIVTANSGIMTIHFKSDAFVTNAGWNASWNCTSTTAVEEINSEEISVYPNPASSLLNIITTESNQSLVIYSALGKRAGSWQLTTGKNSIDISYLRSGVYFLELKSGRNITNKKIVIQ